GPRTKPQSLSATVAGRRDRVLTRRPLSRAEPARRLGERRAELAGIPRKSTDHTAEIPPDGRETLPLLPVPMWNGHLLSQHTVSELQIALGLSSGHTVSGGAEPRLGFGHDPRRRP